MQKSPVFNSRVLAHLALFGAALIYGANYLVAKWVMPQPLDPNSFILLRIWGACLLFWMFFGRQSLPWPEKKEWGRLLLCAITGVLTNQLLFFNGLSITSPMHASIMMTSNPMIVLLLSVLLLRKSFKWHQPIGIGIGAVGACLIIMSKSSGQQSGYWVGDLCILINSISWGTYLVIVSPLMRKYNPMAVTTWVFTIGAVLAIPLLLIYGSHVDWQSLQPMHWWCVLYVIVGTTFLTYALNMVGVKHLTPTTVSAYIYLQPLLAAVFTYLTAAWFVLDYTSDLNWHTMLYGLIVIVGVYLACSERLPFTRFKS